jgi:hypothetical protein
MQKTWIELLGRNTDYVHVDENRIVRDDPEVDYPNRTLTVLWTFDTPEQAETNFQAWLREVIKEQDAKSNLPPAGTWASVAFLMAQGDDSGFDWDAWKDEMKERE